MTHKKSVALRSHKEGTFYTHFPLDATLPLMPDIHSFFFHFQNFVLLWLLHKIHLSVWNLRELAFFHSGMHSGESPRLLPVSIICSCFIAEYYSMEWIYYHLVSHPLKVFGLLSVFSYSGRKMPYIVMYNFLSGTMF